MSFDGSYDDFSLPVIRGDDYEFPFVVRIPSAGATAPYDDANSTRAPLGGWQAFWCTGKRYDALGSADTAKLFQVTLAGGGIVLTNAAEGEAKVVLTPAETGVLPAGQEIWVDVQGKDAAGKIHTLCTGKLPVRADVTRSAS